MTKLREALAANAHNAWAGWMMHMMKKSRWNSSGSITIPANMVQRWTRQMMTAYENLPEKEKASDRAEADKILKLLDGFTSKK